MLQRNTSGNPVEVLLPSGTVTVEPDGEVEHGLHISGFTPVEDKDDSGYGAMLKKDLEALAAERDLDTSGTKAEIVARLVEADETAAAAS